MAKSLFERAESIRARAKIVESVPGSGLHDGDRDWKGNPIAPQRRGLPYTSEHVVAFMGDYDVRFSGKDAVRVMGALKSWYEQHRGINDANPALLTGTDRNLIRLIPKHRVTGDGDEADLLIHLTDWNDFLHAIYHQKIGVTIDPLEERNGAL